MFLKTFRWGNIFLTKYTGVFTFSIVALFMEQAMFWCAVNGIRLTRLVLSQLYYTPLSVPGTRVHKFYGRGVFDTFPDE